MRKVFLRLLSVALFVTAAGFIGLAAPQSATALSGSEFQAGRIIDDGTFFDSSGLSKNEIQTFLNAKVPTCDTNGTQPYAGTTRGAYGTSKGYPPPYTCLKDYRQDTVAKPAEAGLCSGYGVANQSAAEIIYGVAQSCGVSPRVLIVLLQKEQGLVTDDWPWSTQYRSATGYGCPDTAPCDSQYYGFFNQVYAAARQYKRYAQSPGSYNYVANRNNTIQYSPNAACGGSTIYIQNQATAGLYNYTPYQPNQAALNNLYGNGDGCSAYGNRNFWRYYNDWFGSTFTPNYYWQYEGQAAWTDNSKTTLQNTYTIIAGNRYYLQVKAKNSGLSTWHKGSTQLGTSSPRDRSSIFKDWTWTSTRNNRTGTMVEDSVAPGQTATFEFWIQAPSTPGTYREYFTPLVEGVSWMNDRGLYFEFKVNPVQYLWEYQGQFAWTDNSKTTLQNTYDLLGGQRYYLEVRAKNMGNVVWPRGVVNLGTADAAGNGQATSPLKDWTWLSDNRTATIDRDVPPGESGTFGFWVRAPLTPGTYKQYFNPVADGRAWMNPVGLYFGFQVRSGVYAWEWVSQAGYTDQTKTTPTDFNNLSRGGRYYLVLRGKNMGNVTWRKGDTQLGTSNPRDRSSIFKDWTWTSTRNNRTGTMVEDSVAPGQTATFEFWIQAPSTPGTYREYFTPLVEGVSWMNDAGVYYQLNIP